MKQELLQLETNILDFNENNFIVSESNILSHSYICNWPDWKENMLFIYGPNSCGKTHLLNIWAKYSQAKFISFDDISLNNIDFSRNLIVENIEQFNNDEASLFHFYNNFKEKSAGSFLVFSANKAPSKLQLKLPDLKSRLNCINSIKIEEPDENLLKQFTFKLFLNKQIKVENDVINFLILRIERSFSAIKDFVNMLDKESLKQKRNITIPFVKQYL